MFIMPVIRSFRNIIWGIYLGYQGIKAAKQPNSKLGRTGILLHPKRKALPIVRKGFSL